MNWENVNLKDGYERDQNILDPYSFDTLLLEIRCNLKEINPQTVTNHFETALRNKMRLAREVFYDNAKNIIEQANKERNEN
jgi:hypothetical protein